jgi:hypothetical protein
MDDQPATVEQIPTVAGLQVAAHLLGEEGRRLQMLSAAWADRQGGLVGGLGLRR